MRHPVDVMLDKVDWKCCACGVSTKVGCDCAEKRDANRVTLRCPSCQKTLRVERDPLDPNGTEVVEVQCPECSGGDFGFPTYFDAFGNELKWDD